MQGERVVAAKNKTTCLNLTEFFYQVLSDDALPKSTEDELQLRFDLLSTVII